MSQPTEKKRPARKAKKAGASGAGAKPLDPFASALRRAFVRKARDAGTNSASGGEPKALPVSPLAPEAFPSLPPLAGVAFGTARTGIKYKGRPDLLTAVFEPGTSVAGVFTRTTLPAAPVLACRANLADATTPPRARLLVVNAGNANAFTGKAGEAVVKATIKEAREIVGGRRRDIFVASTGVIGEPFEPALLTAHLAPAIKRAKENNWAEAAKAIMTTDTFPKGATATATIDGVPVTVNGIAKGSGMIEPDMATMLAFIVTDATIPSAVLESLLTVSVRDSFNAITVDGDSSTNDSVLLFATGRGAQHEEVTRAGDRRLASFREALDTVMVDLAKQVVRDGEGASKFIEVLVTGAKTGRAATAIARSIANSPLVKTALGAGDANWGRLIMAIGKAGQTVDPASLGISIGGLPIVEKGERVKDFDEAPIAAHMAGTEIALEVSLGMGNSTARIWTCDLTHGYISINADYRS